MKAYVRTIQALALLFVMSSPAAAGSITGELVFPPGYTQTGDMHIWVRTHSVTDLTPHQQFIAITEAEATAGTPQAFTVPGLLDGHSYTLFYQCSGSNYPQPCESIVEKAY